MDPMAVEDWFTLVSPYGQLIEDRVRDHASINRSKFDPDDPKASPVYALMDGFHSNDRYYWIPKVRKDRMSRTSPVLYRKVIVDQLMQHVEDLFAKDEIGMMVKGPEGVGKSFTIMNLVRKLLSTNKYIVTFIPNCEEWVTLGDLYFYILASVGVDKRSLKLKFGRDDDEKKDNVTNLIDDIDALLQSKNKRWVFVFDQINHVFSKRDCKDINTIGSLPFPYSMMKSVMKAGRIISIISASANNEAAYKDRHVGFDEFDHDTTFTKTEIQTLYGDKASEILENAEYDTGFVPFYIAQWVQCKSTHSYRTAVLNDILYALIYLKNRCNQDVWKLIVSSAIMLMLGTPSKRGIQFYDRKYSLLSTHDDRTMIKPLFLMVVEEYRNFFRDELMEYVSKEETHLLAVCNDQKTTNDTRGRIFEMIIIGRVSKSGLLRAHLNGLLDQISSWDQFRSVQPTALFVTVEYHSGNSYPEIVLGSTKDTLFIPTSPTFPAVDAIVYTNRIVIGFQIHTSDHSDVRPLFLQKARDVHWLDGNIIAFVLVYLSPLESISLSLKRNLNTPCAGDTSLAPRRQTRSAANQSSEIPFFTVFCAIDAFPTIGQVPWNLDYGG